MAEDNGKTFQFEISLSVLNHLGRNLYRNFVTVLGEAISNSWDADAENVWVDIYRDEGKFIISDDGKGMTADEFQNQFLKIGYSKRKDGDTASQAGRPYIGAKGIGKLALLSCAKRITVFTKTVDSEYVGGTIDNSGLDEAIKNDLVPDDYPLESLDFDLIDGLFNEHAKGTIIVFEGADEILRNTDEQIRKVLAMSFQFSTFDPEFTLHVNDVAVSLDDLADLMESTEFVWIINDHSEAYTQSLENLKADPQQLETALDISGYVASVALPRHLKIRGMDTRATVDLFVNGRIREKNVIRHVPKQRIVENYIYGHIYFNSLDRPGKDPFTSSREGIVEDDEKFKDLLDYLRDDLLPKVIDDWDRLRLERGKEGDDENARLAKKQRKAADLYAAAREGFEPEPGAPEKDLVDEWLDELAPDAQFNLGSYADCFLSENLVRKFVTYKSLPLKPGVQKLADDWKKREDEAKAKANISYGIRQDDDPLCYLDMDALAVTAEGSKTTSGNQSLWLDAISYKPVRNIVGHTGRLTDTAKSHLSLTFQNIRNRVKALLKQAP